MTGRRAAAATGAVVCAVLGLAGGGAAVASGWSAVPETGAPGGLVLRTSTESLRVPDLEPGRPAYWQVHTSVDREGPVRTELQLHRDGALVEHPDGLRVTVTACQEPWRDLDATPVCDEGAHVVSADPVRPPSADAERAPVSDPGAEGSTYLLVELAVADSARASADSSLMGLEATVGLGVTASVDDLDVDGLPGSAGPGSTGSGTAPDGRTGAGSRVGSVSGTLARTGAAFAAPVLLAAALVLTGVALRLRRDGSRSGGTDR